MAERHPAPRTAAALEHVAHPEEGYEELQALVKAVGS